MIEADTAFLLAVCDNDPVAFEAACRMSSRDLLSLCEAYLRRIGYEQQAAKRAKSRANG